MPMKTSPEGRRLIIQREGFRLKAYLDTKGIPTIGVGHTSMAGPPHVTMGMTITKQQVDEILTRDLKQFESAVNDAVRVPLTQNQFDACVSLAFNIGAGGFTHSTVVKRLNQRNYRGAADAFLLWNKPPEIIPRRRGERQQFLRDTGVLTNGKPVKYMAAQELHPDERVSLDYMRASDSRVVKQADDIQTGLKTAAGATLATVTTVAANVSTVKGSVDAVKQGAQDGASLWAEFHHYLPWAIVGVLTLVLVYVFWRMWRASEEVQHARLMDAVYIPDEITEG